VSPLPTRGHATILPVFPAMVAGWLQRHQQQVITSLIEENPCPQRPPWWPPLAATVWNILRRHYLEPAPRCRKVGMSGQKLLKRHWEMLAATDFFTVEVATWHGLMTYDVLVVMELATRRVQMAGITPILLPRSGSHALDS
jgi:hypothetical protein